MLCEVCFAYFDFATSNIVVLGVIGADIMFAPLFNYTRDNFDPCKTNE